MSRKRSLAHTSRAFRGIGRRAFPLFEQAHLLDPENTSLKLTVESPRDMIRKYGAMKRGKSTMMKGER